VLLRGEEDDSCLVRQAGDGLVAVLRDGRAEVLGVALACLGLGKTTSVRILVDLLERRGVSYVLLSPTGKAAKRLSEATLRDAYTIHRQLFSLDRQRQQMESQSRGPVELFLLGDAVIVDEASMVWLAPAQVQGQQAA